MHPTTELDSAPKAPAAPITTRGAAQPFSELALIVDELRAGEGPDDWLEQTWVLTKRGGALDEP